MQVKQQEGPSPCWMLDYQQQKLITLNLRRRQIGNKAAKFFILLLETLCLYEIGSMQ